MTARRQQGNRFDYLAGATSIRILFSSHAHTDPDLDEKTMK